MHDLSLITAAALLGWALTGLAVRALADKRHRVHPNERSMHVAPTPAGGGIAIVAAVAGLWSMWAWPMPFAHRWLLALALLLALVSWVDDVRHLWPATRFAMQVTVVAIGLAILPDSWRVLHTLPLAWERVALGLAWVWFINLTNFMDGIDGIAASETIAVALGYAGVLTLAGSDRTFEPLALIIAGAAAGYLVWNWHPARIFMGDVGSIPLGFLLGWLMLDLAGRGLIAAALILPMYFLADATITLARRVLAGEKPWQAHRTHFYQRAVQGGLKQDAMVLRVTLVNGALIVLALVSVRSPLPALAVAGAITAALLISLEIAARPAVRHRAGKAGSR